jgi:hypothetical protein
MAHRYEKREKHTGVGSIVKHIAYCPTCGSFVEPKEWRTSRRGTHATVLFVHEHPLSFVSLYRSSLGHASVSFEGEVPEEVKKAALYLWVWERLPYEDVEEIIKDPRKLKEVLEEVKKLRRPAPPPPPLEPNVKLLVQTQRGYGDVFAKIWKEGAESIFDMPDCTDAKLLAAVRDALSNLEDRFNVPPQFSSGDYCLPRYFLISAHFDGERAQIIDIINVRRDGKLVGKWSYRKGYWTPLATERILDALDIVLRSARA